ncbi:fluoride efflux transporter CrcB [Thalassiella azotivora]
MTALLVAVGAAVGAPARWALDRAVQRRHDSAFPWGTVVVNVLGSLLLGALLAADAAGLVGSEVVALVGTGLLGAFTTFSTFAVETVRLAEEGDLRAAVLGAGGSVVATVAAATLGWAVVHAVT